MITQALSTKVRDAQKILTVTVKAIIEDAFAATLPVATPITRPAYRKINPSFRSSTTVGNDVRASQAQVATLASCSQVVVHASDTIRMSVAIANVAKVHRYTRVEASSCRSLEP